MKPDPRELDARFQADPRLLAYLPRALLLPFRFEALAANVLLTAMFAIGVQSILGIPTLAIASVWLAQYTAAVIERAADGAGSPPAMGGQMLMLANPAGWRPVVGIGLLVTGYGSLSTAHPQAAGLVLALGLFLLPGWILLATLDGLFAAFHPGRLFGLVAGMGRSYILLCALLAESHAGAARALLAPVLDQRQHPLYPRAVALARALRVEGLAPERSA